MFQETPRHPPIIIVVVRPTFAVGKVEWYQYTLRSSRIVNVTGSDPTKKTKGVEATSVHEGRNVKAIIMMRIIIFGLGQLAVKELMSPNIAPISSRKLAVALAFPDPDRVLAPRAGYHRDVLFASRYLNLRGVQILSKMHPVTCLLKLVST